MSSNFQHNLEKYADVVVKVGLNLQPGQRLVIGAPAFFIAGTPIELAPLVRSIAASAYKAGARLVDVMWHDEQMELIRLQHAPADSFGEYPSWRIVSAVEYAQAGDAILIIYAADPNLLDGQDLELLAAVQKTAFQQTEPLMNYITHSATNWSVISGSLAGWAGKLFPDMPSEQGQVNLWDTIFDICRVKLDDPIAAWRDHVNQLATRCDYLNTKQYTTLKLTAPGTDLTVGLPQGNIWRSGRMTSENGIDFTANIPTEEVFTMPHKDRVDGVVKATKPLNYGGATIEDFSLTFKDGRVVDLTAAKGEDALRSLIATDEGAAGLGEIALVPHSSPISQSGMLFYNILIDENAANHIALGLAYRFSLEGGETLSPEEFQAAGGNQSLIHVDFMIGSGEMDIKGISHDGPAEDIMVGGEWAFED
jgi:aminopeptidase